MFVPTPGAARLGTAKESYAMPTAAARHEAIAVAVEIYNCGHPKSPLPRPAARLLGVMFSTDDVCRRSLEALVAEGFTRKTLPGMLCALIDAGLLSKEPGSARIPNTYRLHLPMLVSA
jgi:hypothetical protein